jgi:leader peptidase (prepilin peptidase)/N-methyltransferase
VIGFGHQNVEMTALAVVVGAAVGAAVGSFVNLARWRVPRHESIVRPPSHCGSCGTMLAPRDLVPVFSWLWLRGRCRTCSARIGASSLVVELVCALVGAAIAWLAVS